jgi:molybdopterin synthase catalytic subunit
MYDRSLSDKMIEATYITIINGVVAPHATKKNAFDYALYFGKEHKSKVEIYKKEAIVEQNKIEFC